MRALAPVEPALSAALRGHLVRWLGKRPRLKSIAAFAALPDEPDLLPLLASLPGCRWVLPRVAGPAEIDLHLVAGSDDLAPGAFGIPEPDPAAPKVLPEEIDVFLCPGLAFDSVGHRLGRGRGYYDRLLAAARLDAELVGIASSERIVAAVPALPHDIRMGWLASEKGVEECGGGRSLFVSKNPGPDPFGPGPVLIFGGNWRGLRPISFGFRSSPWSRS